MTGEVPAIEELIVHRGMMRLVDAVYSVDENEIAARSTVPASGPFGLADGRVPGYLILEFMAQTVAAYGGYHRRCDGLPPAIGLLLGSRRFRCSMPFLPPGSAVLTVARTTFEDGEMASFDCRSYLTNDDRPSEPEIASAMLNVYQPRDIENFVTGGRDG